MGEIAVRANGLSKRYLLGGRQQHDNLRERIAHGLSGLAPQHRSDRSERRTVWALKDVSFEVRRGQIVGIIGSNGAGKSTLLKILSRITEPTAGFAEISGRVGSLLEVGTGFHPELTGWENIYLSGVILGMKKREIHRKLDEIVAFAEIEKFLETPVKHYSSGMYLRLAFAVAAHLEPEILLVDEVLAVGDAAFQQKCLGKMGDVAKEGRTVLFVSHNMAAIARLCERTILLGNGHLKLDGPSPQIISSYLSSGIGLRSTWMNRASNPFNAVDFLMKSARVLSLDDHPTAVIEFDRPFRVEVQYEIIRPLTDFSIICQLTDSRGNVVWTSWDSDGAGWENGDVREAGRYLSRCTIPASLLKPGLYNISLGARSRDQKFEIHEIVLAFRVSDVGYKLNPGRAGVITPLLEWQVKWTDRSEIEHDRVGPSNVRKRA